MQIVPALSLAIKLTGEATNAINPLVAPMDKILVFLRDVDKRLREVDLQKSFSDQMDKIQQSVDNILTLARHVSD